MVVKEVRRYVDVATDKLSSTGAQELARSLMQGQGKEQVSKAAQELMKWSNKNRERAMDMIRTEVTSQMKTLGVVTRDELDALRKRVRELERAQAGAKKSTAARSSAKRTTSTKAPAAGASGRSTGTGA